MCPHPRVLNIIAISPVPIMGLLCLTMSHQTVELRQVVDLHQPAPVQLALAPGLEPSVIAFRKKVFVAFLQLEISTLFLKMKCFTSHTQSFHSGSAPEASAPRQRRRDRNIKGIIMNSGIVSLL